MSDKIEEFELRKSTAVARSIPCSLYRIRYINTQVYIHTLSNSLIAIDLQNFFPVLRILLYSPASSYDADLCFLLNVFVFVDMLNYVLCQLPCCSILSQKNMLLLLSRHIASHSSQHNISVLLTVALFISASVTNGNLKYT